MMRERAEALTESQVIDLAAIDQLYVSNPDLVERLCNDWPFTPPDRDTYCSRLLVLEQELGDKAVYPGIKVLKGQG